MCISGKDKLFFHLPASDLASLQEGTEVLSSPLWLCLDLFVAVFHAVRGVVCQLLTKSWCVQQCLFGCKVYLLRRPELSVMGLAHAQAYLR